MANPPTLIPKTRPRTSDTHKEHLKYLQDHPNVEVVMLGSSHFERFLTTGKGLVPEKIAIAGVGGDQVEHMLWRVENGLFENLPNLKKVIVVSGGNNITAGQHPKVVAEKVAILIDKVREKVGPNIVIEVTDTPVAQQKCKKITENEMVKRCIEYSQYLQQETDKRQIHMHHFQQKTYTMSGNDPVRCAYLFDDNVHLNRKGYEIFASVLFGGQ
jgi:lysophospholipase L1-like esterase